MNTTHTVSVLVVDDSHLIREQVIEMLKEYPEINVIGEAAEIGEALRCIIREQPDAVVLDISMPGGNGFTLLEYIKTHRLPTKVIMLSNHSDFTYRSQAFIYGADYFFDKANEFEKIIDALHSIGLEHEEEGRIL